MTPSTTPSEAAFSCVQMVAPDGHVSRFDPGGIVRASIGKLLEGAMRNHATPESHTNSTPDFVAIAAEACQKCKEAERLLAQVGAYEQAAKVRDARESLEECTVESIANLRPKEAGNYQPETLAKRMDEANGGWA